MGRQGLARLFAAAGIVLASVAGGALLPGFVLAYAPDDVIGVVPDVEATPTT